MFLLVVSVEAGVFFPEQEKIGAGLTEEFQIIVYLCVLSEFSRQSVSRSPRRSIGRSGGSLRLARFRHPSRTSIRPRRILGPCPPEVVEMPALGSVRARLFVPPFPPGGFPPCGGKRPPGPLAPWPPAPLAPWPPGPLAPWPPGPLAP